MGIRKKLIGGALGLGGLGAVAYGVKRFLGSRAKSNRNLRPRKSGSNEKLRNRIQKIKLKRLEIVEKRKLFKERLRV